MNRQKLLKMKGKQVRLSPTPQRYKMTGEELPPIEYWWLISNVSIDLIELTNQTTGQVLKLGIDIVREFMSDIQGGSDGFLQLKMQVIMKGSEISAVPYQAPQVVIVGGVLVNGA